MIDRLLARMIRIPGTQSLWRRFPVGSATTRVRYGIWSHPHYAYGVHSAAALAKRLGMKGVTAIEFGVAGGNGLLALEQCAKVIGGALALPIAVLGFDTGVGMPAPSDFRDLPYVWGKGFYSMDVSALRNRLSAAQLMLGDVRDTVPNFLSDSNQFPIGFVAFD